MNHNIFGRGLLQYLVARLQKKLRLSAIKDSTIHATSVIEAGCQVIESSFDRHSFCGYDCVILNADIGSFCSIADYVYIGGAEHPMHFVSTSPVFLSHRDSVKTKFAHHEFRSLPRTSIGHDVWIGFGAKIKAGVCVGTGAVVGMGAVVTKDVSPYMIVAGNPAREIRYRFPPNITAAMQASIWWEYNDEQLREAADCFNSPLEFLKKLDKQ